MKAQRRSRLLAAAVLVLLTGGCPRRFDPRAQEIPTRAPRSEDGERYRRALQALDEGDAARARDLALPLAQPPGPQGGPGPQGEAEGGELRDGARYVLGVASHRLGDFATARAMLKPLAERIVNGGDATELHAILADLYRREGQTAEALREYERFYRGAGARPVEQAYARAEARRLLATLPEGEQSAWRGRFELEPAAPQVGEARAAPGGTVGLVVPLSGKDRALGERVLRGALLGLGLLGPGSASAPAGPGGGPSPLELRVRDSASSPERAAAAAAELAGEGVVALIGSPARAEEGPLEQLAVERGVPLLALGPGADGAMSTAGGPVLHLLRGNAARARALAQHALQQGARTVAVVAPATAYGKAMTRAVREVVDGSGGRARLVAELTFPEGTTTFSGTARQLLQLRPEALVLPVSVGQLELLAAQLAASGVIPTQNVPTDGRQAAQAPPVRLVLSTAEGLGERLLRNAGRYLQGAVLAPLSTGAIPTDDPALSAAAERYRLALGEEPGALDALGFDAARLLLAASAACEAGGAGPRAGARPCPRPDLLRALSASRAGGATGPIAFDAAGQRAGAPLLLRVEGGGLRLVRPPK